MSKIPEGATHTFGSEYKKLRPGSHSMWLTYADGDWIDTINTMPHLYVPIQTEPEWTGEGFPPAGIECEHLEGGNGDWERVTVIAIDHRHGFQYAVFHGDKGYSGDRRSELFRPVPTAKQIAAEKRLAAINWMEIDAGMCATAFDGDPEARRWIENLIDKGWSKEQAE